MKKIICKKCKGKGYFQYTTYNPMGMNTIPQVQEIECNKCFGIGELIKDTE